MPDIARPLAEPHAVETCYGSRLHCVIHDCDEPEPAGGPFRVCGECFHVYATEADLVAATNRVLEGIARKSGGTMVRADYFTRGDEIFCCAFCTHDW